VGVSIRKLFVSLVAIFALAIVFLIGSIIAQLGGIYGAFFSFGFPEISTVGMVEFFTSIFVWIMQTVIRLFLLGVFLSLVSLVAAKFVQTAFPDKKG